MPFLRVLGGVGVSFGARRCRRGRWWVLLIWRWICGFSFFGEVFSCLRYRSLVRIFLVLEVIFTFIVAVVGVGFVAVKKVSGVTPGEFMPAVIRKVRIIAT